MTNRVEADFECRCHGDLLRVSIWRDHPEDPPEIYLSAWQCRSARSSSWRQRLRHIWRILRCGQPYLDDMILSHKDALRLARFLDDHLREP